MPHTSDHLHFDLMIRPESGNDLPVSLWVTRGIGFSEQVLVAPPDSWRNYSKVLEEMCILNSTGLGAADACLSRGEAIVQPIHCSRAMLMQLGLREHHEAFRRGMALTDLFRRDVKDEQEIGKKQSSNAGLHPRFWTLPERGDSTRTRSVPTFPTQTRQRETPDTSSRERPSSRKDIELAQTAGSSSFALLGVRIENLTMQETLNSLDGLIEDGGFHQVATANVDFLTKAFEDRELLEILHSCELVLPDGMPLVWAAKLMGVPLKQRVTGADLLPRLFEISEKRGRRIFLLGATEERSRAAVERINREYPGAILCGRYCPPFAPLDEMDNDQILDLIHQAKPDILLVAFGNPKQEKWLFRHRHRLQVPICIGVGASIDFFSGMQSRAPVWMQRSGLEWVHRLASEPRRLALRYLRDAVFISRYMSMQLLAVRLQTKSQDKTEIQLAHYGSTPVLCIAGTFSVETAGEVVRRLSSGNLDHSLIIDFTATSFISPDATGLLMHLAQRCASKEGTELWIAGLKQSLRSALRATFPPGEPFHTANTLEDALRYVTPMRSAA